MSVTIYDLANAAGVSISTVSKALNDSYSISDETKERIKELAAQLGYVPNVRAASFAKGKNGTIIFAADFHRGIGFDNPHMFEIITGIERFLGEKGYSLTLKYVEKTSAPVIIRDMIHREMADGVIMHAGIVTRELAGMLLKETYPHLVIGKPDFSSRLCWIDISHETAGEIAAEYMLEKGYKNILFMMGDALNDGISARRFDGFCGPIEAKNQEIETVDDILSYEEARQATLKILDRAFLPDVIICANNYLAMGCIHAAREKKIEIPQTLAIMTFDNYPFATITEPALTAIEVDMFEMGWQAAGLMLQKIKKPNLQTQSFCTTPIILERESTKGHN